MENEIKFPDYCIFGKRLPVQPKVTDGEISCRYELDGTIVYELVYNRNDDIWKLNEFGSDGKVKLITCNKSLDLTICNHTLFANEKYSYLPGLLQNKIDQFGIVCMNAFSLFKENGIKRIYSPAGRLLLIRLLLWEGDSFKNQEKTLSGISEYHDQQKRIKLKMHRIYETSALTTATNGTYYIKAGHVAEFIVPLAWVFDTVKIFNEMALINLSGPEMVFITDTLSDREGRLVEFATNLPGVKKFNIVFNGLFTPDSEFQEKRKQIEKILLERINSERN